MAKVGSQYDHILKIAEAYYHNPKSAKIWMYTKNPLLRWMSPSDLLRLDLYDNLLEMLPRRNRCKM